MKLFQKALFLPFLFLIGFFAFADNAQAQMKTTVAPAIITESGEPRDLFNHEVTITNPGEKLIRVFPYVNNVFQEEGEQDFAVFEQSDRTRSLANWIEFTREVITLEPGESKTFPLKIKINHTAVPGEYHAQISFGHGTTREEAKVTRNDHENVFIVVDVESDARENIDLLSYQPRSNIFFKGPVTFNYTLKNSGNRMIHPKGTIRILNGKGKEIAVLNANSDDLKIDLEQEREYFVRWENPVFLGRYKAMMDIQYGSEGTRVNDSTFVWFIPWQKAVAFLAAFFLLLFAIRAAKSDRRKDDYYDEYWDEEEYEEEGYESAPAPRRHR